MEPAIGTAARARAASDAAHKACNCKNSKCLKLYCECFASGKFCDGCNCVGCKNNVEHARERQVAIEQTLERNANAFRPKIVGGGAGEGGDGASARADARHHRGCHCKRSGCLKKYCECFQAAIFCVDACRCAECKNFEGSDAYEAVKRAHGPEARFHDHASAATSPSPGRRRMLAAQQAANGGADARAFARASPKLGYQRASTESDSSGVGERGAGASQQKRAASRDAASVPLMHNLVQQGAVEELARILLCVADETKASAPAAGARGGGVAAVAELAAAETNARDRGDGRDGKGDDASLDALMCDEAVDEIRGASKDAASPDAGKAAYADRERALLGELERVVSRLTHNAKARVEHSKKYQRAVKQRVT